MCTQKKNHEKRIKKKEIFVYSKYLLYLCAVNDANKQKHGSQSISYIGF